MMPCHGQGAKEALSEWLALQGARLKRDANDMEEQEAVFESFMRVLGDDLLSSDVRVGVARGFIQCIQEELFSETQRSRFESCTKLNFWDGLPHEDPDFFELAQAFGMAAKFKEDLTKGERDVFSSLEGDLARQTLPLSLQINEWLCFAGRPELALDSSFDDEPQSLSFARLLAKRQPTAVTPACERQRVLRTGVEIIAAIAEDSQLRAQVFAEAEGALGTCGDAADEGFSAITRLVRRHRMREAVKRGEVGGMELRRWALREFRLHALEEEVSRFISRSLDADRATLAEDFQVIEYLLYVMHKRGVFPTPIDVQVALQDPFDLQRKLEEAADEWPVLDPLWSLMANASTRVRRHHDLSMKVTRFANDPLEIVLHAKVALRLALDLPEEVPSHTDWESSEYVTMGDLNEIRKAVQAREADDSSVREWLLGNDGWRAGMKQLHCEAFQALDREFDDDPFFDLDLPPQDGDEYVAARAEYAEAARDLGLRKAQAENELLCKLAGLN
jgi:hypothetical protein